MKLQHKLMMPTASFNSSITHTDKSARLSWRARARLPGYEASPLFDGAVSENCVRFPWHPGHVIGFIPRTWQCSPRSAMSATIETLKKR